MIVCYTILHYIIRASRRCAQVSSCETAKDQDPVPESVRISRAAGCITSQNVTRIRDFKDTVHPFFKSDTLFLECVFVLSLVV